MRHCAWLAWVAGVIMSHHSTTHSLQHFLLSHSMEFGRDQNQVTFSYARPGCLSKEWQINEGNSKPSRMSFPNQKNKHPLHCHDFLTECEYDDSVNDTSGRMELGNVCQHAGVNGDCGDTWTHLLWQHFLFSISSSSSLLMSAYTSSTFMGSCIWPAL